MRACGTKVLRCADFSKSDFVVYAGYEQEDRCFFRKQHHFSQTVHAYLERRRVGLAETWLAVDDYQTLSLDRFASIKTFTPEAKAAERLSNAIEEKLNLHAADFNLCAPQL